MLSRRPSNSQDLPKTSIAIIDSLISSFLPSTALRTRYWSRWLRLGDFRNRSLLIRFSTYWETSSGLPVIMDRGRRFIRYTPQTLYGLIYHNFGAATAHRAFESCGCSMADPRISLKVARLRLRNRYRPTVTRIPAR